MVRRSQRREFRDYDAKMLREKLDDMRKTIIALRSEITIGSPIFVALESLGSAVDLTARVATGDADEMGYRGPRGIAPAKILL